MDSGLLQSLMAGAAVAQGTSLESQMRIHNIYADENGETHFRDIEIELSEAGPDGTTSKRFPASGIIFRTTPADWFFDWHPATRRQYVINLDACLLYTSPSPRDS